MGIKHAVNKKFFKSWSPNMAYVLGYIYADGCLIDCSYIRASYIKITSVEKDSLERIRTMMSSEHKITSAKSLYKNGRDIYLLKIGSNEIYDHLLKLGLYSNKSLTIKFPDVPKKFISHFIRGYFDGDGCIYFEKALSYTGRMIIKRIRTIFTSGSKLFLKGMLIKMSELGIDNGKIYNSHRSFQLVFNNKDSIKIFKLMYKEAGNNSFFMRKFAIFNEYFQKRPVNIDIIIKEILRTHNQGLVAK